MHSIYRKLWTFCALVWFTISQCHVHCLRRYVHHSLTRNSAVYTASEHKTTTIWWIKQKISEAEQSSGSFLVAYVSSSKSASHYSSGVPGGWGVPPTPPPPPKLRSFDNAEPNSHFCGKYICNNLTRIWLSLIFFSCFMKRLPCQLSPPQWYFFSLSPRHDVT
jgi:hypothetical protein